jgi:serine/threonine-protein kinase
MWQALAGRKLFTGDTNAAIFLAARNAEVPELGELRPDLPKGLVQTVKCVLSRDPDERFESANDMRLALTQLLRKSPVTTDAKLIARAVAEARDTLGIAAPSRPPPPVR